MAAERTALGGIKFRLQVAQVLAGSNLRPRLDTQAAGRLLGLRAG
jgi:hypothetical protein